MNLTETIKRVQRHVGAEVDGIFGPVTAAAVWAALTRETEDGKMQEAREEGVMGETGRLPVPLLDERSRKTILTLDPKAVERFTDFTLYAKAVAAAMGCEYVAICGHRSWEEQDELYKRKPPVTRARGGESNHNFGIAVDYGVFQGRGQIYCDDSKPQLARRVHLACAAHARACGLEWGGDWPRFRDFPHYEIETNLTMAQMRELYREKGSVL